MGSMRMARAAVKYSVVNHANELGLFKAIPVKRTVQRGKRVVARPITLVYVLKSLDGPFSSAGAVTTASSAILSIVLEEALEIADTREILVNVGGAETVFTVK